MRIEKLNQTTKKNLLEDLLKRSPNSYEMYEEQVKAILDNVKKRGDEALFEYTEKFDGFCLDQQSVLVKEEEIVWICGNCGHIFKGKEAPEKCPVCAHPKAYFEKKADNYL